MKREKKDLNDYKFSREDKPVSREMLTKLVDIARIAPTGSNSQGISFVVVEDKQLVEKAAELTIRMIEKSPLKDALKGLIST